MATRMGVSSSNNNNNNHEKKNTGSGSGSDTVGTTDDIHIQNELEHHPQQQKQSYYKPVHIYPYSTDLSTLQLGEDDNNNNQKEYIKVKRFHVIRHAEGTHNVNREYKDIINLDARLTDLGKEQCQALAKKLAEAATEKAAAAAAAQSSSPTEEIISTTTSSSSSSSDEVSSYQEILQNTELVVTSPLTRCLQTALLSFPSLAETETDTTTASQAPNINIDTVNHPKKKKKRTKIPFVAHEGIRETVNYACDRRRSISSLEQYYHDRVCFDAIEHDHDEIWDSYVRRLGRSTSDDNDNDNDDEFWDRHRESAELHVVADRARNFLSWVRDRDEREIIVCTHSAFLRCILSWGQSGGVPMMMPQVLDTRRPTNNYKVANNSEDDNASYKTTSAFWRCARSRNAATPRRRIWLPTSAPSWGAGR